MCSDRKTGLFQKYLRNYETFQVAIKWQVLLKLIDLL